MSYSHEYNVPVIIGTGAVLTQGDTADLVAGQIGIFNNKTYEAISGQANPKQSVIVASGSWHKKDKLNKYWGGLQESIKTTDFLGQDVFEFQRSAPRQAANEQWVLGYDGINDCYSLNYECGKTYTYKVRVWGEDVYGTFLRPLDRFISVTTDCCDGDDCTDSCSDGVSCKKYAQKLADIINNDPELQYFVRAEAITSDSTPTAATHRLYCLDICDNGDQEALAAVRIAYPSSNITRISREDSISTYQFCNIISAGAPANFTPTSNVLLAVCNECPSGYTLVSETDLFIVNRPLAGTETLNTSGAKQTYADSVLASYNVKTFNGATAVDPATNQITITNHGFVAGTAIVYSNGGGTSITGLTSGNTYYVKTVVDANNITLSATNGGAVIDITADGVGAAHTLTLVGSTATFLSQNGSVANIQIKLQSNLTLTAALADSVTKIATNAATCAPGANSAISWTACGDRYKTTRTLGITLEKECGTGNRLADLVAFYANAEDVVPGSITLTEAGTCNDNYTIQQYNNDCLEDGCLTNAVPQFDALQSFEGFVWGEVPCTTPSEDAAVLCGVRIEAAYEDTRFGGCTFSPNDYYSIRPLKLEITEFDDSGLPCAVQTHSRKIRNSSMATQSGEYVIRQLIGSNKYRAFGEFYHDPRMREVLDAELHEIIDRNKFYNLYYLKFKQNRGYLNGTGDYAPEIYEVMFAFPQGVNMVPFETMVEQFTSQFGVHLQDR